MVIESKLSKYTCLLSENPAMEREQDMRNAKHTLGKALAGVMLALLMAVGLVPTTAIAQEDASEEVALTTQASTTVIRGNGWKLSLPKYWRGKVKAVRHGNGGYDIVSKKGKSKGLKLASIDVVSASIVKSYPYSVGQTVRLKNGKTAKVVSLSSRSAFSRGAIGFFAKMKKGKYLMVSSYVPWTKSPLFNDPSKCLPSKARLRHYAKLQSLGKTTEYGDDTQVACLKAIAKSLKY